MINTNKNYVRCFKTIVVLELGFLFCSGFVYFLLFSIRWSQHLTVKIQTGFKLMTALPATASRVLHLKGCATTPTHLELEGWWVGMLFYCSTAYPVVYWLPLEALGFYEYRSSGKFRGKFQADRIARLWNTESEKRQGNETVSGKGGGALGFKWGIGKREKAHRDWKVMWRKLENNSQLQPQLPERQGGWETRQNHSKAGRSRDKRRKPTYSQALNPTRETGTTQTIVQ